VQFNVLTVSMLLVIDGRWLDKLGVAARMGIDVVARQSFFHGHYALLDDDMHPRPVCRLHLLRSSNIAVSQQCICVQF